MNIFIPDSWLREFLETKATPKQIKEYLSLCGPSVERIHEESSETVYDIEITSNRPDAMCVVGVAREAAAILPRFGIGAKLVNDPYALKGFTLPGRVKPSKMLTIKTDAVLNPRWTSIVFENVTVKQSPEWLKKKLEATGIRSINNIIDITNFLMRAYGQPAHAFDYNNISGHTMLLRAAKHGERITTLDGKTHILPGGDIVIEDGSGKLIDLCGIMGAQNSAIKDTTTTVILFLETYNPAHIRKTMMTLAHRTEAGGLFEKGTDPELVLPAFTKGVELISELSGGKVASKLYDIYPKPYKAYTVSVLKQKLTSYIGVDMSEQDIVNILTSLGFSVLTGLHPVKKQGSTLPSISVRVPSFRRDVTIDVDIIEELARMYGYHNITVTLPDTAPPVVLPNPMLNWEEEIKVRLRDWGYTETYTYSMISRELMDMFGLDKTKAYRISNPLSREWVYMRPSLWPSVLTALKQNVNIKPDLKLFELSMVYEYRSSNLPIEKPILLVAWIGKKFSEAKGLGEAMLNLFGAQWTTSKPIPMDWYSGQQLQLGSFGSVGLVHQKFLDALQIHVPVTILELDVTQLVKHARPTKQYIPIPKYPPSFEDLAFILPPQTPVGPILTALKDAHPLVADVSILDTYETTTTFHIVYQSPEKNLTTEDLRPVRAKLITIAGNQFGATLKTL